MYKIKVNLENPEIYLRILNIHIECLKRQSKRRDSETLIT